MNILVVAPYGANQYHFETDLELAQKHLVAGDTVTLLTCSADLSACDVNIDHQPDQCLNCIFRRKRALRSLSGQPDVEPLLRLEPDDRSALATVRTTFSDLDDLRSYRFGSFDLGIAVVSSLVSFLRDPEPSLISESSRIRRLTLSSAAIYLAMKRRLGSGRIDRVYTFNGRFATMRAVLRACQDEGTDCLLHDRGSSPDRYALYANALPHDVDSMDEKMRKAWIAAGESSARSEVAANFFEERRRGEIRNWYSFTSHQKESQLPGSWDENHRNIVIFPSSEDEFVAIGEEWRNPLYANQEEGLTRIVEDLRDSAGVSCHIRLHPNMRYMATESLKRVMALEGNNIHVEPPDSEVSSYAMLFASDIVLTFGSTMGIEATYWGKPSVLAGKCFYRNLGSTHNPESHTELMALLRARPVTKDRLGALIYGHYLATFGEPFVHFRPDTLWGGEFRQHRIGPGPIGYRLITGLRSQFGYFPLRVLRALFEHRADRNLART